MPIADRWRSCVEPPNLGNSAVVSDREPAIAAYIVPIRLQEKSFCSELAAYLNSLRGLEVVVVDDSAPEIFDILDAELDFGVAHIVPDQNIGGFNGKVRGVLTGLARTRQERVVVADDDVRYDAQSLARVLGMLDEVDVVRPQNFFWPRPWHALLDASRSLIARALDGDWPGTLAFRRSALPDGYDADVLFENFQLVKTIRTRGGSERVARDVFVRRLPPTTSHFWSQRVRQAYDEFARPARMGIALSTLPALAAFCSIQAWALILAIAALAVSLAAIGWLRVGAHRHFSPLSIAAAPLWVLERGICSWLALYQRLRYGGIRYGSVVIARAAS